MRPIYQHNLENNSYRIANISKLMLNLSYANLASRFVYALISIGQNPELHVVYIFDVYSYPYNKL